MRQKEAYRLNSKLDWLLAQAKYNSHQHATILGLTQITAIVKVIHPPLTTPFVQSGIFNPCQCISIVIVVVQYRVKWRPT